MKQILNDCVFPARLNEVLITSNSQDNKWIELWYYQSFPILRFKSIILIYLAPLDSLNSKLCTEFQISQNWEFTIKETSQSLNETDCYFVSLCRCIPKCFNKQLFNLTINSTKWQAGRIVDGVWDNSNSTENFNQTFSFGNNISSRNLSVDIHGTTLHWHKTNAR